MIKLDSKTLKVIPLSLNNIKHQFGISLIEVLISLMVLSIGLLGLAALQIKVLKYNQNSGLKNLAINQVNDIIDRMLSNKAGLTAGVYSNLSGIPTNIPSCQSCTTNDIAQRDLYEWNTTNAMLLPSGQGKIQKNNSNYTITLMWDAYRTGASGTECSNDYTKDLFCLHVNISFGHL